MTPQNNIKTNTIKRFLDGKITFKQAKGKLGKSRATVYRYAKLVHSGKKIIDRRKFGNNRKYGKG